VPRLEGARRSDPARSAARHHRIASADGARRRRPGDLGALRARARKSVVPLVRGGASLEQPIDARDVVTAIAAALARPQLAGRVLDVAGPESLARRELVLRAA
jgi:uncharacterized protein YbjT (DUF2867 family)